MILFTPWVGSPLIQGWGTQLALCFWSFQGTPWAEVNFDMC